MKHSVINLQDISHPEWENSIMGTRIVSKEVIQDLEKLGDEMGAILDSINMMSDKGFMKSYRKAKRQIKSREFAVWGAE